VSGPNTITAGARQPISTSVPPLPLRGPAAVVPDLTAANRELRAMVGGSGRDVAAFSGFDEFDTTPAADEVATTAAVDTKELPENFHFETPLPGKKEGDVAFYFRAEFEPNGKREIFFKEPDGKEITLDDGSPFRYDKPSLADKQQFLTTAQRSGRNENGSRMTPAQAEQLWGKATTAFEQLKEGKSLDEIIQSGNWDRLTDSQKIILLQTMLDKQFDDAIKTFAERAETEFNNYQRLVGEYQKLADQDPGKKSDWDKVKSFLKLGGNKDDKIRQHQQKMSGLDKRIGLASEKSSRFFQSYQQMVQQKRTLDEQLQAALSQANQAEDAAIRNVGN